MRSAPRTNQTTKITSMKAARAIPVLTEKDKARFWAKVDKSAGPEGCWIWMAARAKSGYGAVGVNGEIMLSHRVAFVISGGVFDNGPLVTHGPCNNRACVNPLHLRSGTHRSNMDDMVIRDGTSAKGVRSGAHTHPEKVVRGERHIATMRRVAARGEAQWASKLTEKSVSEIRRRYAAGGIFQRELAIEFGVDQGLISYVVRRKIWQHVA
jgi:hypothetical protein